MTLIHLDTDGDHEDVDDLVKDPEVLRKGVGEDMGLVMVEDDGMRRLARVFGDVDI